MIFDIKCLKLQSLCAIRVRLCTFKHCRLYMHFATNMLRALDSYTINILKQ